jgi:hypothetical protein
MIWGGCLVERMNGSTTGHIVGVSDVEKVTNYLFHPVVKGRLPPLVDGLASLLDHLRNISICRCGEQPLKIAYQLVDCE